MLKSEVSFSFYLYTSMHFLSFCQKHGMKNVILGGKGEAFSHQHIHVKEKSEEEEKKEPGETACSSPAPAASLPRVPLSWAGAVGVWGTAPSPPSSADRWAPGSLQVSGFPSQKSSREEASKALSTGPSSESPAMVAALVFTSLP